MSDNDLPRVEGVEHRFVQIRGIRVHVAEAGESDAPPVLLLHGWPQHWYMWRPVLEALQGECRLIAPDLRGFGWSEAPGVGYDPETFAGDQVALLDELGIERVRVAGHDWGGFTALLLGMHRAERVERALILNAPHPWAPRDLRNAAEVWRIWYAVANASPLGRWGLRAAVATNVMRHGNVTNPWESNGLAVFLRQFEDPERIEATQGLYRSYLKLIGGSLRGRYARDRLEIPALLVFGERDRYVSRHLIRGHERNAPRMEVEMVPDSGHFIVDEKPDLVVDRLRSFLLAAGQA
jgi:pimeloyl-ACP methyl ester carboxylesterase